MRPQYTWLKPDERTAPIKSSTKRQTLIALVGMIKQDLKKEVNNDKKQWLAAYGVKLNNILMSV